MGEFFQYVSNAFWHLWPLLSAGSLLGIEEALGRYWAPAKEWSDRLTHKHRRAVQITALFAALFYSGFLAWREEHAEKLVLESHISATGQRQDRHLTEDQKAKLKAAITPIADKLLPVVVMGTRESESLQYATEFMPVFHEAGLRMPNYTSPQRYGAVPTDITSTAPRGILLGVHDKDRPPAGAIALRKALEQAIFPSSYVVLLYDGDPEEFVFVVGPPR